MQGIIRREAPSGFSRTDEKGRGRREIRETFLYRIPCQCPQGWESVRTVVRVRRDFRSRTKAHVTESLYATDIETGDASLIAQIVRSHWFIENKLHYTKDVIMKEDRCSTGNRNAAANLAFFRNFAFNILKEKNRSVKYATEFFANMSVKDILKHLTRT